MRGPHLSSASVRIAIVAMLSALSGVSHGAARALVVGDPVRVTRSEMLLFQGKNLAGAAKGQEFTLLKHDPAKKQVFVSFMKDDGTLVAATLPDEAVEPGVVRATSDLVRGVEAFRDQRYDEAKRLLTRAALDKRHAALAGALFTRVNGAFGSASLARTSPAAKQAATTTLQTLRDTAEGLAKAGMTPRSRSTRARTVWARRCRASRFLRRKWIARTSQNAPQFHSARRCSRGSRSR